MKSSPPPQTFENDEIDLFALAISIWTGKTIITGMSLFFGLVVFSYMKTKPSLYVAKVRILPLTTNNSAKGNALSALSALTGINNNSGQSPQSIDIILNSRTFKETLVTKYDLLPKLFPLSYKNGQPSPAPDPAREGASVITKNMSIKEEPEGTTAISFEHTDPKVAFEITQHITSLLGHYIEKNIYTNSKRYRELVEKRLEKVRTEIKELRQSTTEDRALTAKIKQSAYESLNNALEQAKLEEIKNAIHFEIIDPPLMPLSPSKPNRKLATLIALAAGAIFGLFIVVFKEAVRAYSGKEKHNYV